jgi:two-component system cell cycle response regulator DivK
LNAKVLKPEMPKILLIEDNELNRDMLARRLEKRGYTVLTAVDGTCGIAVASNMRPDLILMDMSLPGLDGWETTRELRILPKTRSIPVIALTAHALPGDRERALDAGCDEYETKPVDLPELVHKIENLLARNGFTSSIPDS